MKNTILFILLFSTLIVFGQGRSLNAPYVSADFGDYQPQWHYTVYDSTNIGFPIERYDGILTNGHNATTYIRPWSWKPVITDKYIYGYTTTFGTTAHIYGAILYKIDRFSGEVLWQEVFDNRHIDRQEYVQSIELQGDVLEVITMKRIDRHESDLVPTYNVWGADSYVCTRRYHIEDGSLLDYTCWEGKDDQTVVVAPHSDGLRMLRKIISSISQKNLILSIGFLN